MSTVISIITTLLVFSIIVLVHEGGHFLAARWMGVFVEEFSIGMGPLLLKHKTKKDLQVSLRLLPIGGFCKMKGEEPQEGVEQDGDSFAAKKPWRRAVIVAAGPFMNFILAFVLMLILNSTYGFIDTRVAKVEEGLPAYEGGMEVGDRIVGMNGESVHAYDKISFLLYFYEQGESLRITVRKPSGETLDMDLIPVYDEEYQKYRVGFSADRMGTLGEEIRERGFFPALGIMIGQSFWDTMFQIESTVRSFGLIFSGKVGLDGLSGPIGIASVVNDTYNVAIGYGFLVFLATMADLMVLISANLGVLNLFPVPGLDGSRLIFLALEKIRKKPMNPKVENAIYLVGFVMLFGLMILVAVNDVINLMH
ncbi:MAG: site-2 protease family protein [Lachnospiraceae bacterium]|nr:site-2 protease family protein [Lachnospiraceae bacterium]